MELTVETLLRSVLLLDEERMKRVLAGHRRAFDLAVKDKLISPVIAKKYLNLKRQVFDNKERKMTEKTTITLTEEKIREVIEKNDLIDRRKWSLWVPLMFLMIPEGKFIPSKFILNTTERWGYVQWRQKSKNKVPYPNLQKTLNGLLKNKGFFESKNFTEFGKMGDFFGKENTPEEKKVWKKENVHGGISSVDGSRIQSVFRLTDEGQKRALEIFEELSTILEDSREKARKRLGPISSVKFRHILMDQHNLDYPQYPLNRFIKGTGLSKEDAKIILPVLYEEIFNEFLLEAVKILEGEIE